jgi:hypothetical protein
VPNVIKIWDPKPPGTVWATPGLLRDSSFYFRDSMYSMLKDKYTIVHLKKVKFTLEEATKAHRGSRGIALFFI